MTEKPRNNQLPPIYLTACGGRIYEPERYPSVMYRGKQIFLCNQACLKAYEADPDRFMSGDIEHPLEQQ